MSGFADRIFGYFAILQQMGGFADRPDIWIFYDFATGTGTAVPGAGTVSAPQILIGYSQILSPGYPRGPYGRRVG
jgi:hypothetical protein